MKPSPRGLLGDRSMHRHSWVVSEELFWTEHGGDIRVIWCEVCNKKPGPGEFPVDLIPVIKKWDPE